MYDMGLRVTKNWADTPYGINELFLYIALWDRKFVKNLSLWRFNIIL